MCQQPENFVFFKGHGLVSPGRAYGLSYSEGDLVQVGDKAQRWGRFKMWGHNVIEKVSKMFETLSTWPTISRKLFPTLIKTIENKNVAIFYVGISVFNICTVGIYPCSFTNVRFLNKDWVLECSISWQSYCEVLVGIWRCCKLCSWFMVGPWWEFLG